MERMAWSDERLEDRFDGIDRRFDRIEQRMDAGFARVDADIRDLRAEMHIGFAEMRRTTNRVGGGVIVGLVGVIATIIASGGA